MKSGRSVKWTSDRTEAFLTDAHGRDHVSTAKIGFDSDDDDDDLFDLMSGFDGEDEENINKSQDNSISPEDIETPDNEPENKESVSAVWCARLGHHL